MAENFVITVARGFGTGGKEIASELAKELGINCYENRILTLASEYSGLDRARFVDVDEKLNTAFIQKSLSKLPRSIRPKPATGGFVSNYELFKYQEIIINKLAEAESCVIVGKCADHILRGKKNVFSFYIEAPREYTRPRIMEKMSVSEKEADRLIAKTDKFRADYYKFYTGGNYWTNPVNYHMTFNCEKLGKENIIKMIKYYLSLKGYEI